MNNTWGMTALVLGFCPGVLMHSFGKNTSSQTWLSSSSALKSCRVLIANHSDCFMSVDVLSVILVYISPSCGRQNIRRLALFTTVRLLSLRISGTSLYRSFPGGCIAQNMCSLQSAFCVNLLLRDWHNFKHIDIPHLIQSFLRNLRNICSKIGKYIKHSPPRQ